MKKQLLGLKAYLFGQESEKVALSYLKKHSFKILNTNYHTKYGEIDIIAIKNNILHFIEVKSSKSYEPHYYLNKQKYTKILKSIEFFLVKNNDFLNYDYCLDLICVTQKDGVFECDFIENISIS